MPIGRAGGRSRRVTNGGGPCNSGRKMTRSNRSRPSSTAAACPLRGQRAAAERGMAVAALAPAKVNLYLHVTGRRDDGRHLLDSLVAFVDIGDHLRAEPAASLSLMVDG